MRPLIVLEEGLLSVDDTVLDRPHSQEGKTDLVGYSSGAVCMARPSRASTW
jgi:hypothetical protein